VTPDTPGRADPGGVPHATGRSDRSDRDCERRRHESAHPVRWRTVRTAAAPAAATATPPARSPISVTGSGSATRDREAQRRLCATGEDRLQISCRTKCVRKENWTSTHRGHSEPGQAHIPGATCSLLRGGHAVSRNGTRGVAPTPPGAQRRAHREMGLHGSRAIARPDNRNRGAVTAAQCGSTRVRLIGGGSCWGKAHENRPSPPRGCHGCGLSWVWAGGGLSTSPSYTPWTASVRRGRRQPRIVPAPARAGFPPVQGFTR
jgi:hypothetical protein